MLIGLSGKAQSGKDTVAEYLVEKHGFRRIAFADKLKDAWAALFNISRETVDELKLNPEAFVDVTCIVNNLGHNFSGMTVRRSLQRMGTEMGREVFGENFWVNLAFDMNTSFEAQRGKIVVSDCRFDNEYAKIKSLGGHNVRVIRPDAGLHGDDHSSENEPNPKYVDEELHNIKGLDYLYGSVDNLLYKLMVRR